MFVLKCHTGFNLLLLSSISGAVVIGDARSTATGPRPTRHVIRRNVHSAGGINDLSADTVAVKAPTLFAQTDPTASQGAPVQADATDTPQSTLFPEFDSSAMDEVVTAVIGKPAFLPCAVAHLGDRTVSRRTGGDVNVHKLYLHLDRCP